MRLMNTSALPNHLDVQRQANLWHSAILYNHVCFMHDQSTSFLPYEVPLSQRGSINLCFLKLNYYLTCNLKLEIVAHDAEVWPWPSGRSCAVWHYENWQADSSPAELVTRLCLLASSYGLARKRYNGVFGAYTRPQKMIICTTLFYSLCFSVYCQTDLEHSHCIMWYLCVFPTFFVCW